MMYHGTSKQYATLIQSEGLDENSYVTSEFEFAAGYALRQGKSATILCFDSIDVVEPDELAYWGRVEFVTVGRAFPSKVLRPKFDSSNLPEDYYELNDDISDRKYPQFFRKENWQ